MIFDSDRVEEAFAAHLAYYGKDNRRRFEDQLMQEMAELQKAILKARLARETDTGFPESQQLIDLLDNEAAREVPDVLICLEHLGRELKMGKPELRDRLDTLSMYLMQRLDHLRAVKRAKG